MRALISAIVLTVVVALGAWAQTKSPKQYRIFIFSNETIGVACKNGNKPFVTESDVLIVTCAEPK
jgi:hypothetical protein